jgi:hypothetical protein
MKPFALVAACVAALAPIQAYAWRSGVALATMIAQRRSALFERERRDRWWQSPAAVPRSVSTLYICMYRERERESLGRLLAYGASLDDMLCNHDRSI